MLIDIFISVCLACLLVESTHGKETLTIVDANNRFALDLYKKLIKTSEENVLFSPVGISSGLAMTLLGAQGDTAQQLKDVLHLVDLDLEKVKEHLSFRTLLNLLQTDEEAENVLQIANRVFMDDDLAAVGKFEEESLDFYGTVPEYVDFSSKRAAEERINQWVRDETVASNNDLVGDGVLTSKAQAVLANAVYFKGTWLNKFVKDMTRDFEFHRGTNDWVNCQIMIQHNCNYDFGYHEELQAQVLAIPFTGEKLKLVLLVPTKISGLSYIEDHMEHDHLKNMHKATTQTMIDVFLPKLKLDESHSLKDVLKELGLQDLFLPDAADLSAMSSNKDFFFNQVLHKVHMEMDEAGSVVTDPPRVNPTPIRFVANRPFFFYIQDVKSGAIVFMGRVRKPSVESRTSFHDEL